MPFSTALDEALEAWEYTRSGVISEISNLPDVSLTFRPTAASRTPAEIAIHIVESGLMMAGELSRPDGNFRRKSFPQFMKEYAKGIKPLGKTTNKKQLVQLLTKTQAEGAQKLAKAGELHMLQLITRFDGVQGTRLAWMNHGISHEEYHRGQLALYARLVGRVPALTQLIYGKKSSS